MPKTLNEWNYELHQSFLRNEHLKFREQSLFSQSEHQKDIQEMLDEAERINKELLEQLKKALKSMINDEGCVFGTDIDEVFAEYGLVTEKVPSLKVSDDLVDEGNTPTLRTVAEGENPSKPNIISWNGVPPDKILGGVKK